MPRYYYYRSPSGTFLRWLAGAAVLFFGVAAAFWAATVLLSAVWPFLLVAMLAAAACWAIHRLR